MKRLFLTSSAHYVIKDIARDVKLSAPHNKLVFITTAAEGEDGEKQWLEDDKNAVRDAGFDLFDYTITGKTSKQIKSDLLNVDFIYFSGGNTFFLLEKAQESECISVIRDLVLRQDKIYIGSSAGSIAAGPDIDPVDTLDDPEKAPNLKNRKGFNLVNFVVFPHWGSENFKDRYLHQRLEHAYTTKNAFIVLPDNRYVKVEDDMYKIVKV